LDDTLVSVLENRPANCEIIVVHAKPYDDPYDLAGEVRFLKAPRRAGLVECLNLALSASLAPVVHVLACGVEVTAGWADAALPHFHDPQVAAVAAMLLDSNDRQKVISAGLAYRAEGIVCKIGQGKDIAEAGKDLHEPCGPDVPAAFYRKSALEAVGRFSSQAADSTAGIDVALALRQAGFRCVSEPACIARADAATLCGRTGFRHGCDAERIFWRWASAHGWVRSLLAHAALLIGECIISLWHPLTIVRLVGRAWGLARAVLSRRHPQPAQPAMSDDAVVIPTPHCDTAYLDQQRPSARAA